MVCQPLDVTSHLDFFECSSYLVNIVKGKSPGRKPGDPGSGPSSASSPCVTWESHSPLRGRFPAGRNQASFQVVLLLSAHVSRPQRAIPDPLSEAATAWPNHSA